MDVLKELKLFNQIEKKLALFFITFSSTQIVFLNSRITFLIPILCLSFAVGKGELLLALLSLTLGSLFLHNYTLLLCGVFFIVLLSLMVPIYSMKTRMLSLISGLYIFCVQLIFYKSSIQSSFLYLFVGIFLTYIFVNNLSCLIHENKQLKENSFYFIGLLLFYAIYPILNISPIFFMIWFRLLILGIMYIADFKTAYTLAMTGGILLLVNDISILNQFILFIIPFSFSHFYVGKTKLAIAVFYVFSHLIIPFLTNLSIKPIVFEVIFSSISFMMIPSQIKLMCDKEADINKSEMSLTTAQRKLIRQLDNYSDLFYKIAHSFNEMELETNVISYLGYIQENLCHQCINCESCFNKYKGDHRLVKLLKKGIIEGLNKEEQHYVQSHCLNMAQYKKLLFEQHKLYVHQKEMNNQYHTLKHHLYDQLSLVGELLKNYSKNIHWADQYHEDHLKDLLEAYHYKIWHIHKEELSMKTFKIDIGMTEVTKREVYDVVVPILEKALDTKLIILKFENSASQLGYTHLILSNHHHYDLISGFQQISKDRDFCGDSFLNFQYHSKNIIALSDGMGFGKKAHEESELTLDVFSRMVKSGIQLDDCIQTINALLRIKNRVEMFTTLDILMFDSAIGEATFIKNGAMPSYIYRNNEFIKIEPDTLPIGIIRDLKTYKEVLPLHEDDLLIMLSDGFDFKHEEVLKEMIAELSSNNPQYIADKIMQVMLGEGYVDDDMTIVVLKVKKVLI